MSEWIKFRRCGRFEWEACYRGMIVITFGLTPLSALLMLRRRYRDYRLRGGT